MRSHLTQGVRVVSTSLRLCLTALTLCPFILFAPVSYAQVSYWAGGGLGLGQSTRGLGQSVRASAHVTLRQLALGGRYTYNVGGESNFHDALGTPISDWFTDRALLVGYVPGINWNGKLFIGAGPSLIEGVRVVGMEPAGPGWWFDGPSGKFENVGWVWGLALEAGAFGQLFRYIGYTVVLHGNLNRGQSFAGLTVGLAVGKLK